MLLHTIGKLALESQNQVDLSSSVVGALQELVRDLEGSGDASPADQQGSLTRDELEDARGLSGAELRPVVPSARNVPSEDTSRSSSSSSSSPDPTPELVSALERERLAILSDLQQQEHIRAELRDLLTSNQRLVADVTAYLTRPRPHKVLENAQRLAHYKTAVVEPTIAKLSQCTEQLEAGIAEYHRSLVASLELVESTAETLASEKFQEDLNELVDALNEVARSQRGANAEV